MIDDILGKKYRLESSENFDAFLKKLGINYVTRKLINVATPVIKLTKSDEEYLLHSNSTFKNSLIKFQQGIEIKNQTPDGRIVKSLFDIVEDTITETQIDDNDQKTTIVRTFTPVEVRIMLKCDDVSALRLYKAVD